MDEAEGARLRRGREVVRVDAGFGGVAARKESSVGATRTRSGLAVVGRGTSPIEPMGSISEVPVDRNFLERSEIFVPVGSGFTEPPRSNPGVEASKFRDFGTSLNEDLSSRP